MSIAVDNGEEIGQPGCGRAIPCFPACESPADIGAAAAAASDSGSSSIGRNSDCSLAGGEDAGEAEVQSSFKGPLETMDALEDSLPMRRGISKFYCGKSKSFAVISDAMGLSSGKELGKPESAYSRKRKKLLSLTGRWEAAECDRDRSGGSKRRANCSAAGIGGGGAPWASPPVETEKSSFPWRSFSLIDLEGIESLSSSSSSLSSMCYEEQKGFS